MKSLAKYTWLFVSALCAASLVACAKAGNNNSNTVGVYPPYGQIACTTYPCAPAQYPTNQLAFYSQNSLMDTYYQQMGYTANPAAAMQVHNGMRQINKYAMGVCDRNHSDYGLADCSSWISGYHDMVIVAGAVNSNTVKVVIRSYPKVNQGYWYTGSIPSFSQFVLGAFGFNTYNNQGVYNPMILEMKVNPINGNKGFELRGYGPEYSLASGILFQIQVPNGKLEDAALNYTMYFNGTPGLAATGSMARCMTQNCGLPFAL